MMSKWKSVCLFPVFLIMPLSAYPWGFFAHKKINEMAVFTLPPEMFVFYKKHLHYITEHAVDPDKRRNVMEKEPPRHYIDLDHYSKEDPFEEIPQRWDEAVLRFTKDTLNAYGILPWQIEKTYRQLLTAFRQKDIKNVLRYSAELGHYAADAHVPLHTTENYDGQLTGQRGIHALWESRIPELKAEGYDFLTGRAKYIEYVLGYSWSVLEKTHACVDTVLTAEAMVSSGFSEDKKYVLEIKNGQTVKAYSEEYAEAYHRKLNGMVERKMQTSVYFVGSLWYSAWVDAGQPQLI